MKLLFLQVTSDYDRLADSIKIIAHLFGYGFISHRYTTADELSDFLSGAQFQNEKVDLIYIGCHSNAECMAPSSDSAEAERMKWSAVAVALCGCQGLSDNTKIILGGCSAGAKRVALTFMINCESIGYVAGVPCLLNGHQAPLALHTLLYGLSRQLDDTTIAANVSAAIGIQFRFYSRLEMDAEILTVMLANAVFSGGFPVPPPLSISQISTDDA